MKKTLTLLFIIFSILPLSAKLHKNNNIYWSSNNNRLGLYSRMPIISGHSLVVRFSTNYYYGDIEKPKSENFILDDKQEIVNNLPYQYQPIGFHIKNQIGVNINFQYNYQQNPIISYRAQVGIGLLRGKVGFVRSNNIYNHVQRQFENVYLSYSVGAEVHPLSNGLYLFVGVGGLTSIAGTCTINQHDILLEERTNLVGNTTFTIPVSLGYRVSFQKMFLNIEASWNPTFIDAKKHNLDGYVSTRYPVDPTTNKFSDGYFDLGLGLGFYVDRCW